MDTNANLTVSVDTSDGLCWVYQFYLPQVEPAYFWLEVPPVLFQREPLERAADILTGQFLRKAPPAMRTIGWTTVRKQIRAACGGPQPE